MIGMKILETINYPTLHLVDIEECKVKIGQRFDIQDTW